MSSNLAFTNQGSTTSLLTKPVNINQKTAGLTFAGAPAATPNSNATALSAGQFGGATQPTVGTTPGVIKPTSPTASSALKSSTTKNVDGSVTTHEYHAPLAADDPSNKYNTTTGSINPNYADPSAPKTAAATPQPATANTTTPTGRAAGVINAGQYTPEEKALLDGSAVGDASKNLTKLQTQYNTKVGDIEGAPGIALEDKIGRENAYAKANSANLLSAENEYSRAVSNQGQLIGLTQTQAGRAANAAGTVFGAGINQQGSYGAPAFNPLTGEYTSGDGAFSGVDASSNIQSVKDLTTKINDIDSQSTAVDNNFSRAIDYATNAGLTGSVPILAGFQNRFGAGFLTNPAVIGFNNAIGALNQQLTGLGQPPIDPDTATADTIKQAQQTIKKNLLTQKSNYQTTKDNLLKGGTTSSGSTGGTMFGSFFN